MRQERTPRSTLKGDTRKRSWRANADGDHQLRDIVSRQAMSYIMAHMIEVLPMSQAGALATLWLSHAVVVLLLITALFAGRDAWRSPQGRLLAALAVSLAALELATGPGSEVWAEPLRTALRLVGVANLALLWLFSLSILRDDFRMGRLEVAGTLVLVLGPMLVAFDQAGQIANPVLASFSAAVPFIMIAHIGWICFAEHAGDLVRGRRRARFWIPLILALASLTSVLAEEVADASTASLIRNALAGLPISLVILWWLLAIDPSRLRFTGPASMRIEPQVDSRDAALLVQLLALMEQEELYLEADVRIDQLAQRLGSPVHRLRALINAGLGHRNFRRLHQPIPPRQRQGGVGRHDAWTRDHSGDRLRVRLHFIADFQPRVSPI